MRFVLAAPILLVVSLGAWGQTVSLSSPVEVTTVRAAPTVTPPTVGMTANCMIGASGGIAGLGFGISGGGGIEDKECTLRETARLLFGLGENEAAVKVLCNNRLIADAIGDRCFPVPKLMGCYMDVAYAARMKMPVCKQE